MRWLKKGTVENLKSKSLVLGMGFSLMLCFLTACAATDDSHNTQPWSGTCPDGQNNSFIKLENIDKDQRPGDYYKQR